MLTDDKFDPPNNVNFGADITDGFIAGLRKEPIIASIALKVERAISQLEELKSLPEVEEGQYRFIAIAITQLQIANGVILTYIKDREEDVE